MTPIVPVIGMSLFKHPPTSFPSLILLSANLVRNKRENQHIVDIKLIINIDCIIIHIYVLYSSSIC